MKTQKAKVKTNGAATRTSSGKGRTARAPETQLSDNADFLASPTVEELVAAQGVLPLKRPAELAGGWPADEDVDEFLRVVRRSRI